jgi:hypothetical protein
VCTQILNERGTVRKQLLFAKVIFNKSPLLLFLRFDLLIGEKQEKRRRQYLNKQTNRPVEDSTSFVRERETIKSEKIAPLSFLSTYED